jgi:hypothetical protein
MFKQTLQRVLRYFGYELSRTSRYSDETSGFQLHKYLGEDGSIDYAAYRAIQLEGNKRKLGYVAVVEDNICFLAKYIKWLIPRPEFGICHGTRRGLEQKWFRQYLDCEVIGTEISDTATQFPHTVQWDFHESRPEWESAADFIYSNSFDHTYDPERCLDTWMSCLKPGGLCFLEHSSQHTPEKASALDPFGADLVAMPFLISKWGKGKYGVREILEAPVKRANLKYVKFIVLYKFPTTGDRHVAGTTKTD